MYNMFGLNFYFILKGIRLSGWETKLISIGGSNIDSQVKFIGTHKYFQASLSNLASTIDEKEKRKTDVMLEICVLKSNCFLIAWKLLSLNEKNNIYKILSREVVSKWIV